MKKFKLLALLFLLSFISFDLTYANYKNSNIKCDNITQYKSLKNNDYSYICSINNNNYIVLNGKMIANYPDGIIWDYKVSKNKLVAVSFSPLNDTFNQKVYLNSKKVGNFKYYSHLNFSEKDNSLYFVSGDNYLNKLIKNGKDITPKNIKRIHEFFITNNGDSYLYACGDISCYIYKNLEIISSSSANLVYSNNKVGYIKNINGKSQVIINNKIIYNTFYSIGNLYINEKGDYYLIEIRDGLSYVIKNGEVVSDGYVFVNQFTVSNDFNNYYFISQSKENTKYSDLVFNNKVVYTSDSINASDIYFYKDTIYFLKSDNCFYNTLNQADNDFCGRTWYKIYVTQDGKSKILLSDSNQIMKINEKFIDTGGKWTINFLGFTSDSKKIVVLYNTLNKSTLNFINLTK